MGVSEDIQHQGKMVEEVKKPERFGPARWTTHHLLAGAKRRGSGRLVGVLQRARRYEQLVREDHGEAVDPAG
jgi:hypothetical protein